jgi:hypothetical protein
VKSSEIKAKSEQHGKSEAIPMVDFKLFVEVVPIPPACMISSDIALISLDFAKSWLDFASF